MLATTDYQHYNLPSFLVPPFLLLNIPAAMNCALFRTYIMHHHYGGCGLTSAPSVCSPYAVAGQSRSRRAAGPFEDRDKGVERSVQLAVERCFFEGCLPPPVPTVPTGRPDTVQLWSQATEDAWTVPGEMEDVTIPAGQGQREEREDQQNTNQILTKPKTRCDLHRVFFFIRKACLVVQSVLQLQY